MTVAALALTVVGRNEHGVNLFAFNRPQLLDSAAQGLVQTIHLFSCTAHNLRASLIRQLIST